MDERPAHRLPTAFGDGRYRVRSRVGAGAFATVYEAFDVRLDIPVAVKCLAENWAYDVDVRRRFILEARLLRAAHHPGLVQVHDIGETDDGRPYFVMDFADRGTLADRLDQLRSEGHSVRPADVAALLAPLVAAVDALHEQGYVHRDIKPSNVLLASGSTAPVPPGSRLVAPGERVLVGDLGLAKELSGASGLTVGAGTVGYMSPEQSVPGRPIDARSDIYALSALTAELLSGSAPPAELRIEQGRVVSGPGLPAGLGPRVTTALASGLEYDPGQRPASAGDWLGSVQAALEADGHDVDPATAPEDPSGPRPGDSAMSLPARRVRSGLGHRRGWWSAAALLAVLAAVVGVALAVGGDDRTQGAADTTQTTTVTPGSTPGSTPGPTPPGVTLVAPSTVGLGEKSYFHAVVPDGAEVSYAYEGRLIEGPLLWIIADSPAQEVVVEVSGAGVELTETLAVVGVSPPVSESACNLVTDGEVREMLGLGGLQRRTLTVSNLCQWTVRATTEDTVVVGRHRVGSGEALLSWFTVAIDSRPMEVPGADEARVARLDGRRRFMATNRFGLVEIELAGGLVESVPDAELVGLATLLLERLDPATAAPAVACGLLTDGEMGVLLGVDVTQSRGETPDRCNYSGGGYVVELQYLESTGPDDIDTLLSGASGQEEFPDLEIIEVEGLGDRAVVVTTPAVALIVATRDGTGVQVSVGTLDTGADLVEVLTGVARAVLRRI